MIYVLYNPLANNKNGKAGAEKLTEILEAEEIRYMDITKLDVKSFVENADDEDRIIIAGGDGTIHHFANCYDGDTPEHSVYYYPIGSGNDYMSDFRDQSDSNIVLLNPYIKDLPIATINGQKKRMLNGIGFGIDGYCCEEGDKQRESSSDTTINYTAIAIKGLLFSYKPCNATVTVDGVSHTYRNVWLAPTMNGRYYGGGMMVAPDQNRFSEEGLITTVVMHCPSKLKTLMVFPSIFKGEHIKHTEMVDVLTGHNITVEFDRPTPLQIDGETIRNIRSYSVQSYPRDVSEFSCSDIYDAAQSIDQLQAEKV